MKMNLELSDFDRALLSLHQSQINALDSMPLEQQAKAWPDSTLRVWERCHDLLVTQRLLVADRDKWRRKAANRTLLLLAVALGMAVWIAGRL